LAYQSASGCQNKIHRQQTWISLFRRSTAIVLSLSFP
jgi:hypothetical protein